MEIEEILLKNNFLLILINEDRYMNCVCDIVRSVEKTKNKICYVCISKKYEDIISEFKKNGIDAKQFIFIDTLSSHYSLPKPEKNCIFLDSPDDLDAMRNAIEKVAEKEKCCILLFDTISTLLTYRENFSILKFTNMLSADKNKGRVKKLFIALKNGTLPEKENNELINDLRMFADKTIDLCEIERE